MTFSHHIRPPAVAGMFYPANPETLRSQVTALLNEDTYTGQQAPKAIIVPHAGYIYSGSIAASAYRSIGPADHSIKKVILLGPAHRVPLRGLAAPSVDRFQTPLGDIQLHSGDIYDLVENFSQIKLSDLVHEEEHSLEVQLPFLQIMLSDFLLVPLVVGDASEIEVADVIDYLWKDPESLVVISSDLSHFLSYENAQRTDATTARLIEALRGRDLPDHSACGRIPIAGMLRLARQHKMRIERFDLRNSGDTAGDRSRVVGYGAWGIF